MSRITDDILIIARDPRGLGGKPGTIVADEVLSDLIKVNNVVDNGQTFTNIANSRLNTTIGGTTANVADGFVKLDSSGFIAVSVIPPAVTSGLDAKASCRVKTSTALPAYTASGTGVGKTLTANVNGALPTIDGVTIALNDRILVDQLGSASNVDNGIYTATDLGSGATPWVLTRAVDMDEDIEVSAGSYTFIEEGSTSSTTGYIVDTANPIIIDVTAFTWSVFSSSVTGTTSTDNTTLGQGTLGSLTTGIDNTGIGYLSLQNLTSGNQNTTVGDGALNALSTGSDCTAIGFNALNLSTVSNLTSVGSQSLASNTTGVQHTAVGYQALNAISTNSNCTAVGYQSLLLATGGSNTAIGDLAGNLITTGTGNTLIGQNCDVDSATAVDRIAIGRAAVSTSDYYIQLGQATNSGSNAQLRFRSQIVSNETWIGGGSSLAEIDNSGNIVRSLLAVLTGVVTADNTAVGNGSFASVTTGVDNTAYGVNTLAALTSGGQNTAIGDLAGNLITIGTGNTLIGQDSDVSSNSSVDRIAIGRAAVSTSDYYIQLGQATNSGSSAQLRFRSQIVSNETWIGGGSSLAEIDNSGNIIRNTIPVITGVLTADNTAVGNGSFASVTTGVDNTAYGVNTLANLTIGSRNTAFGNEALSSIVVGSDNVAIGHNSLAVSTVPENTAVGSLSLAANTTGLNNVAFGYASLRLNTIGTGNSGIGFAALSSNLDGGNNTALGFFALGDNTDGTGNTAVGSVALRLNTTGVRNTAVGYQSLNAITTGTDCTALGHNCLAVNTANETTAIGSGALQANTSGTGNTAVGYQSLNANISGVSNTAVGHNSLLEVTSNGNTAIGTSSLSGVTIGADNIGIGNQAGTGIQSGSGNIAIGQSTLLAGVSVVNNVVIGSNSMTSCTSNSNVVVGVSSGTSVTSGGSNTLIGSSSGVDIGSGSGNVCIGASTGVGTLNLSDCVAIGNFAEAQAQYDIQLGRRTAVASGILYYRLQKVSDQTWDDSNTGLAYIDGSGNIEKTRELRPGLERITVAQNATGSPSNVISTTFITTTTGAGANPSGTLADGTTDGAIKNLVGVSIGITYELTVTNGIDAAGASFSRIDFTGTGQSIQLIWDATVGAWLILNSGTTIVP